MKWPWTGPTTGIGKRALLLGVALLAGLPGIGCDESDVVPPAGATVTLNANPATLVATGTQVPQSELSALVTNSIGVGLPGQTVRFSTSAGDLTPPALTPIETDENGIALAVLRTVRTATVEAMAGSATPAEISITVLQGDLQAILLNSSDTILDNCGKTFRFTATALDTNSAPVPGVVLRFELRAQSGTSGSTADWAGNFTPAQGITDDNGEVTTTLFPEVNSCQTACASGMSCEATVVAVDETGLFESQPILLIDEVD